MKEHNLVITDGLDFSGNDCTHLNNMLAGHEIGRVCNFSMTMVLSFFKKPLRELDLVRTLIRFQYAVYMFAGLQCSKNFCNINLIASIELTF